MAITKEQEQSMIMLTILRVDAQRLYERIKYREAEYMHFFSRKEYSYNNITQLNVLVITSLIYSKTNIEPYLSMT